MQWHDFLTPPNLAHSHGVPFHRFPNALERRRVGDHAPTVVRQQAAHQREQLRCLLHGQRPGRLSRVTADLGQHGHLNGPRRKR